MTFQLTPLMSIMCDTKERIWESHDISGFQRRTVELYDNQATMGNILWRSDTITWTNADLASKAFCGIHMRTI